MLSNFHVMLPLGYQEISDPLEKGPGLWGGV